MQSSYILSLRDTLKTKFKKMENKGKEEDTRKCEQQANRLWQSLMRLALEIRQGRVQIPEPCNPGAHRRQLASADWAGSHAPRVEFLCMCGVGCFWCYSGTTILHFWDILLPPGPPEFGHISVRCKRASKSHLHTLQLYLMRLLWSTSL